MMLGRKAFGYRQTGYIKKSLDSVCTNRECDGHWVSTRFTPSKRQIGEESAEGFNRQTSLPVTQRGFITTTLSQVGNAFTESEFQDTGPIWNQVELSVAFNRCMLHPSAPRTYVDPRERKLGLLWSNGRLTTKPQVTCRTRREQTRLLCTLRKDPARNDFGQSRFLNRCFSNGDYETPLYKNTSAYYEILEVSHKATQAQIKTAYYRQSFIYHPDKNAGSEAATQRFSQISEAYNVLGNKGLRKKYDRGILTQSDLLGVSRPSSKGSTGSSAGQTRSQGSVVGVDSKKIYDFDSFIKSHYGSQLQKERDFRSRQEEIQRRKEEGLKVKRLGKMEEVAVGILFALALAIVFSLKTSK